MELALEKIGYDDLRKEQEEARAEGKLYGIGMASFTEVVGAGPHKDYDILGLKMNDGAELRIHPTGKAILKISVQTQGQGHETTFAQIVAEELGIQPEDIKVHARRHGQHAVRAGHLRVAFDADVSGAATAMVARRVREKARKLAAHLLEVSEEDIEYEAGKFSVKGAPDKAKTIQECAFAAYTNFPDGMEAGPGGRLLLRPAEPDVPVRHVRGRGRGRPGHRRVEGRRMVAVDDCGVRINPMIVEGQIHGGLTEGFGIAAMELITFDESGNCIGSNFMDYLMPTAWETPKFELGETVTPSPHHPIGAKGVGESATVGSPAAYVNAVIDALRPLGVTNIDMPVTSSKVWEAIQAAKASAPARESAGPPRPCARVSDARRVRARRAVRARDGRVAPCPVLGQGGVHGAHHLRSPRAGLDRGRMRRADRCPRGASGARGGHAPAAVPGPARGARRPSAGRRRRRPHRMSERGRTGGVRGTRSAAATPGSDRPVAGRGRARRAGHGTRVAKVVVDDGGLAGRPPRREAA